VNNRPAFNAFRARLFSTRILLPLILFGAFALRLFRLGVASLWYDETVSVFLAQKELLALTQHTAGDIHPPFYYYVLHFWGRLAGWSEFSMAFVSLFFGVLLIALTYRVAREWFDVRVGVITALLVALSPYNVWYSQEVRMYTLGAFLGLASTFLFVRVVSHQSPIASRQSTVNSQQSLRFPFYVSRDFVAYAIASALGLYTLYYFAFLLVFQNIVALVWFIRDTQYASRTTQHAIRNTQYAIRTWLFSQLAIVLLFAPWLPIAFRQATDPPVPPWRSFISLPTVLLESFSALVFGQSLDVALTWLPLLFIAALIASALKDGGWKTEHASRNSQFAIRNSQFKIITALFLLAYTFIPLAIIFALSLWKPLYHVRYVFPYSPAFYILLALAITHSVSRFTHHASRIITITLFTVHCLLFTVCCLLFTVYCLLFTFSLSNFWFEPRYAKDDLRGAVRYISEHWRPGDAILVNAGYTYTALMVYFDQPIEWRGRLTQYAIRNTQYATRNTQYATRNTQHAIILQTGSIGGAPNLGWGNPASDFYATTADETRAALDRVFAAHERVWMLRLYDTVVDPDGVVREYLATRTQIIDDQGFAGESFARVQGYISRHAITLPANLTRRDVLLGNRIALLGFVPTNASARPGEWLDAMLYWQAREATNTDARLFVGLFAADGALVASSDELPIGNARGTSRWSPGEILRDPIRVRVPANLAPGEYVLRIALYDPRTHEPLDPASSEWVRENGQVELTTVFIGK